MGANTKLEDREVVCNEKNVKENVGPIFGKKIEDYVIFVLRFGLTLRGVSRRHRKGSAMRPSSHVGRSR